MKDLIKSVIDASNDRLKNPLIGSFIISWTILNWKLVFILLFSSLKMTERIELIDKSYAEYSINFWWPLLVSLLYTIAIPYIMFGMDILVKFPKIERRKGQIARETAETRAKAVLVRAKLDLEQIKGEHQNIEGLNKQIEKLKIAADEGRLENSNLKAQLDTYFRSDIISKINSKESVSEEDQIFVNNNYSKLKQSDIFDSFIKIASSIEEKKPLPSELHDEALSTLHNSKIIVPLSMNSKTGTIKFGLTTLGKAYWALYINRNSPKDNNYEIF